MMISGWTSLALVVNMTVGIPQGDFMSKNFKYVDLTTGLDFEALSYEAADFTAVGGTGNENKPILTDADGFIDSTLIDLSGLQHNDLGGRNDDISTHNSFLDLGGTRPMTGNLDLNSNKIINLASPTNAGDAVNKAYTDAVAVGLSPKGNVAVATTGDITLSGLQTIDGYSVLAGDRVLVKDQIDATENGIYVAVDGGAWTRSPDQDNDPLEEIVNGVFVPIVLNGTVNADKPFIIVSVGTGLNGMHIIGTDDIVWDLFTSPTQLQAGNGIEFAGNIVNVDLATGSSLKFDSAKLAIDFATATTDEKPWKASDLTASYVPVVDAGNYTSETELEGVTQELYFLNRNGGRIYTAAASITKGDLVYVTANDTVSRFPTNVGARPIGVAFDSYTVGQAVRVLNDDVIITGVLTGASFGTVYYWNGTGYQTTIPVGSGAYVWEVGVAKNATDLDIEIRYVKRNS
jgi:hypothetical protein